MTKQTKNGIFFDGERNGSNSKNIIARGSVAKRFSIGLLNVENANGDVRSSVKSMLAFGRNIGIFVGRNNA